MPTLRRLAAGLAAAGLILAGAPAVGADAAPSAHSLELSKRLFSEMHMDQMMDGMMKQMAPAMIDQMRKTNPSISAEDAKAISEAVNASTQEMMRKVMDRMAPVYASTFTEKELQDLVDFYDGPTGRAMLAKMPLLMSKMTPTITEMMPEMQADVTRRICAKIDCTKRAAPPKPTD